MFAIRIYSDDKGFIAEEIKTKKVIARAYTLSDLYSVIKNRI